MTQYTLYHKASGTVIGRVNTDDPTVYETEAVGVFDGLLDARTQYVEPTTSLPADREDTPSVSWPATVEVGTPVTITGLPVEGCWANVRGEFVHITDTTYTFTPQQSRILTAELVGRWRCHITIEVLSSDATVLIADPRWAALLAATPAQVEAWLTNNVTNLAQARDVLKLLLLAVRKLGA